LNHIKENKLRVDEDEFEHLLECDPYERAAKNQTQKVGELQDKETQLEDSILCDRQSMAKTPLLPKRKMKVENTPKMHLTKSFTLMMEAQRKKFSESMASTIKHSSVLDRASKMNQRKSSVFDQTSQKVKDIMKYDLPDLSKSMMTNYNELPQMETTVGDSNNYMSLYKRNSVGGGENE
jgi:hypothetical protein